MGKKGWRLPPRRRATSDAREASIDEKDRDGQSRREHELRPSSHSKEPRLKIVSDKQLAGRERSGRAEKPLERTRSHQFPWPDAMDSWCETKKDEGYQTLEGIVRFSSEILGRYPPNTVVQTT